MPQRTLKEFADAYKVFTSTMTKEEFINAFKEVMAVVVAMKKRNEEEMRQMEAMHEKMIESAMQEIKRKMVNMCEPMMKEMYAEHEEMMKRMNTHMSEMQSENVKAHKEQQEGMSFIYDKVRTMKSGADGKDADEEKIVKDVLARIPEQKVNVSDIEELEEKLAEVKKMVENTRQIRFGGARIRDMWIVETPSGTIDGSNTSFTISTNAIPDSETIVADGVPMRKTRDYTLAGKTLTMNVAPILTLDSKYQKL